MPSRLLPLRFDSDELSGVVENYDNEILGRIEHVMIDADSGRLAYACLAIDGAEDIVIVPWHSLNIDRGEGRLRSRLALSSLQSMARRSDRSLH